MLDQKTIDELTNKIASLLPANLQILQNDISKNIRAIVESTLHKANLVSREEFDTQVLLLERTRVKLEQLEQQLSELETK